MPMDVAPGAVSPTEPASQEVLFEAPVSGLENSGGTAMNSVAEGLTGLAAAATPLVEANPAAVDLSGANDQASPEHIGTGQGAENHPLLSPSSANTDTAASPVASPAAGNPWPEVLVTTLKAANAPPASPEAGSISSAEATGSRVYATVMLNNYDANQMIRQITPLTPAQGGDIWVELLGGPAGGVMTPVVDAAQGLTKFNLSDPGFFDGGCGLVQGVQANEQAQFQLRAWRGAASFEAATERGVSEVWSQVTGRWNADALPPFPPQGPALKLPGPVFIGQLSNSVALVALNNQEANQPIYYLTSPDLASGQEVWVELLAGPKGGAKAPVYKLENGGARFSLAQPGYFDAGLGFIPNATGGAEVEFQLRVWMNAATYEDATEKGQSAAWTQSAGSWDWLHDPAPASAPALELPAPVVISRPPDVVATVALNNFDASQLVYYQNSSTQASGTSFWIELLAGPVGGKLNPVFSTSSHTGRFRLSDPGHFDAGIGTVTGVEPNGVAEFQLRAWKDAGTYAQAAERAETVKWTQAVGSWDRNAIPPAPATGPALRIPGPLVVAVPPVYSATIDLGLPDTNALIFYQVAEARASGTGFSVELLGGPVGGTLQPVAVANGAQAQFPLAGPGYFNAGVGVLPGVAAGQEAQFQLRVWKNAPVYAVAEERGQTPVWTQATGIWQTNAVPAAAPVGVALRLPGAVIVKALDQVATVDLTNLGTGMAILMGSTGQMASGSAVQVELLGGVPGGYLAPVKSLASQATSFPLAEPGYFNAGVGVVPGQPGNAQVQFQIRVWQGAEAWASAIFRGQSALWVQGTGSYDPLTTPPGQAAGVALKIPAPVLINLYTANQAMVAINNYDAHSPLYLRPGELASGGDIWLQLLGGPVGGILVPASPVGQPDLTQFHLTEPGYFDVGVGVVPGATGGSVVQCQLRVWAGATDYGSATQRFESAVWTQKSGYWDSAALPPAPPTGATLEIPGAMILDPGKTTPAITWTTPAAIVYGTPLSARQLDASAEVPGAFAYSPAAGTLLNAGAGQKLEVVFTPADPARYESAKATASLEVLPAPLVVTAENQVRWLTCTDPPLTVRYAGFVNGENPGVLDQPVSVSTTATGASPVGIYPIHIAPVLDDDYAVTVVDATLRVKLPLQVQVSADEGGRQLAWVARLKLAFSESVGNSLGLEDLALVSQASGAAIGAARMNLECQAASHTALLTFPGLADRQLPDGRWVLTVKAAGIQDPDGFPLGADYRFRFGVLSGDANRDGVVNDLDLYLVWQNWIQPFGAQNLAADLNGDQKVDRKDLDLVIANYFATVTQPARGIGKTSVAEAAGGSSARVSQAPPLGIATDDLPKPGATAFAAGASLAISTADSAPNTGAAIPRITTLRRPRLEFPSTEDGQGRPSWDLLPRESPVY